MVATGAPAIVFAPHPDDETLGCGGLIALKCARGARVKVIFLTASEDRRQEALAAAAILGLAPDDLEFLDYRDGGLTLLTATRRSAAADRLAAILRAARPREVYVPHRHDRHADHEATYGLAMMAIGRSGLEVELFQYPIWAGWWSFLGHGLGWRDLAGARRLSIAGVAERKRRAIDSYRSQVADLPPGFLRRFASTHEIYFSPRRGEASPPPPRPVR